MPNIKETYGMGAKGVKSHLSHTTRPKRPDSVSVDEARELYLRSLTPTERRHLGTLEGTSILNQHQATGEEDQVFYTMRRNELYPPGQIIGHHATRRHPDKELNREPKETDFDHYYYLADKPSENGKRE